MTDRCFPLLLAAALVCAGCAGSKDVVAPSGQKIAVPPWYQSPPRSDDALFGAATATSRDLQTAVDKARQDGRAEVARQLDLRMTGMSKRFVEETGLRQDAQLLDLYTQVSKSVISESLSGSQISKQELAMEGEVFRAFVLVEMPIGEANARLVEKIRARERLYTRFRSSKAFEELDREVKEFERWKRQQLGDDGP